MYEFIKSFDLSQWDETDENILWLRKESERNWTKVYCPDRAAKFAAWFYAHAGDGDHFADSFRVKDWLNS